MLEIDAGSGLEAADAGGGGATGATAAGAAGSGKAAVTAAALCDLRRILLSYKR